MTKASARTLLMLTGSLVLTAVWGCGTGRYETRMAATATKLQQESGFRDMSDPQTVPGTTVTFRLPNDFDQPPWVVAEQEGSVDPVRLLPTAFELPGLKLTCEKLFAFEGESRMPYYCYIAVTDTSQRDLERQTRSVWQGLSAIKTEDGEKRRWEEVQFDAPTGVKLDWQKVTAKGPQKFYCIDQQGEERNVELNGVAEVYMHQAGEQLVWIAWRAPDDVLPYIELADMAAKVAGSVEVKPQSNSL